VKAFLTDRQNCGSMVLAFHQWFSRPAFCGFAAMQMDCPFEKVAREKIS